MKRRLFDIVSSLSLLLFVTVVVLWFATWDRPWTKTWREDEMGRGVRVHRGAVAGAWVQYQPASLPGQSFDVDWFLTWRKRAGGRGTVASGLGFDYYNEVLTPSNLLYQAGTKSFQVAYLPMWPIVVVAAICPIMWLYRLRRPKATSPHIDSMAGEGSAS